MHLIIAVINLRTFLRELSELRAERPGFFHEIATLHDENAELREHLNAVNRVAGLEVPR